MDRHYRRIAAMLALLVSLLIFAPQALAVSPSDYNKSTPNLLQEGHLYGQAAVLIDANTGEVLFAKNMRQRMYPASTTKIMTLILALESGIPMETMVVIPAQASQIESGSTIIPVYPGDEMTFRDLLYGFMMRSGNDGANAVAVLVSGTLDGFVERMNRKAAEMGCEDTHFVNAHGLPDPEHYTTARDLALITQYAMQNDLFREIVGTFSYTMTIRRNNETFSHRITSTDLMINKDSSYYYQYCVGVKTGTTSAAGNCFVGAAERDGMRMISVTLKCPEAAQKWRDTARLFDYGFTRYTGYTLEQMFEIASPQIATVKISNAISSDPEGGNLSLRIARVSDPSYVRMVQTGSDSGMEQAVSDFVSRATLTITDDMVAPVSEGEIMGSFEYIDQLGNRLTALLIASRNVEEQPPRMTIVDLFPALRVFENPLVKLLMLVLAAMLVLIIIAGISQRARQSRRRREIYEARRQQYLRATNRDQARGRRIQARLREKENERKRRNKRRARAGAMENDRKRRNKRRTRRGSSSYDDEIFGGFQ